MWKIAFLLKVTVLAIAMRSCNDQSELDQLSPDVLTSLKEIASTEGFKPYDGNPIISMGQEGSWDAGALGSMTVTLENGVFHLYYEAWGVRSEKEWDAEEYESLQIGHATSRDGIHWTKDPNNPVIQQGGEGDFDRTGVWDPYVLHKDGLFHIWYGGGGGSEPNFGWAYAFSEDGSQFDKRGLIGIGNQSGVEDCHVVFDRESELYYMYYWHGWSEPDALFLITSTTNTGFDFNQAVNLRIEGDESYMKKFGHVLRDKEGWHMFYSNFLQPHCPNSITRYAFSEDGIHWEAKNRALLKGHDSEVLKVDDDLYLMFFSPQDHFDRKDCDIRMAVYHGLLTDLASKPPFIEHGKQDPLVGRSFSVDLGEEGLLELKFRVDGEVILSEQPEGEEEWTFNAYFQHRGDSVFISGENIDMRGFFNGENLTIISY